jgi:hypothetical protein
LATIPLASPGTLCISEANIAAGKCLQLDLDERNNGGALANQGNRLGTKLKRAMEK